MGSKTLVDKLRKLKEDASQSIESAGLKKSSNSTIPNLHKEKKGQ